MTDSEIFNTPAGGFLMPPVHPGEILGEEIDARGLNAHALALKLRVPPNRIGEIVAGKRGVSAETALRVGRYFGTGAAYWINLQGQYDLAVAMRDFGKRVEAEVEVAA